MKAPISRVAVLATPIADALASDYVGDWQERPYKARRVTMKDAPNLRFSGLLLAAYSQNPDRQQWEEVQLYAVEGGGFVALRGWHSNVPGQETFWSGGEVVTVQDAMTAWGWSATAKGFAKTLQWDVNAYIGGGA